MGQGLVGADVGDLRRLSAVMDSEAEKITKLQQQLNALIQNGNFWRGNDADQFRSRWHSDLYGRLGAAAVCLRTNARALKLNAEQQEQASMGNPGGGSKGGPSTGHGKSTPGAPGFTFDPTSYGPVTVEGSGSFDSQATGEAHGSVGPGGIAFGGSGDASTGGEMTWKAETEFGPVKTTVTNETFVGARANGEFGGSVPFGLGLPNAYANGEAFAGAENITTTRSDFFDGWVSNTATTRVMTGAEASAHANASSPFLFSAGGEGFAGQKVTVDNKTEFAGGLFAVGQGGELRAGAWASAGEGEVSVKGRDVTGTAFSAGAGAELTGSRYVEVLGQTVTLNATVAAGAGEGHFFTASMDEDGLTLGAGAKLTAELGLGAGGQITLSPKGLVDSVTGFVDFLNN
ncbi:WXG100 family type VII secretion target [Paenarthrobacter nitroguajacolicus]|uniref:WXG100 family type VII secretion target n=1 Tax=Paenarthrobacter nitroguajacolicus TaxID=211146 RepID=UPI0040556DB2